MDGGRVKECAARTWLGSGWVHAKFTPQNRSDNDNDDDDDDDDNDDDDDDDNDDDNDDDDYLDDDCLEWVFAFSFD